MESLRPQGNRPSDDDEVVLLMFGADSRGAVTARDVHEVFEGTVDIPVRAVDW